MIAIARIFLDNVAHIQGSWLTTGKDIGQLSLHYGADDLGSVMLEENVVSSAGAKHRSNRMELIDLIRKAGRVPAQRAHHLRAPGGARRPGERPGGRPGRLASVLHGHRRGYGPPRARAHRRELTSGPGMPTGGERADERTDEK